MARIRTDEKQARTTNGLRQQQRRMAREVNGSIGQRWLLEVAITATLLCLTTVGVTTKRTTHFFVFHPRQSAQSAVVSSFPVFVRLFRLVRVPVLGC
jgi:hypothetical protein